MLAATRTRSPVAPPSPTSASARQRNGAPAPSAPDVGRPTTVAPTAGSPALAESSLKSPDWVKDAIFYQVFPERFRNGDASNDPKGTVPWGTPPQNDQFFEGGDLNGVTEKLGYLGKLGVNALYLNPIFTSPSNHKYDTADYDHVDPAFGGDAAFSQLVDRAHAGGVKLILDGVFNHTSNEHVWFKDVREKGPKSPYWDWYNVHRFPITTRVDDKGVLRSDDYEGWGKPEWGGPYATLPVLENTRPEVLEKLVTAPDSVVTKWMRGGKIDGWRMDAADDVEPEVWRATRDVVKRHDPNAFLVGENWHDASGMLAGDQFDGVMNYKYFQQPANDFFAQKSIRPSEFAQRLRNDYPTEAKLASLNILESHDTPRFITRAGGDWYRARPAAIFQMTYQGAPSMYYGAEIGMEGGADPDSRRAFDWKTADDVQPVKQLAAHPTDASGERGKASQLFGLYQRLIETRKGSDALRRGDFDVLAADDWHNTMSYRRSVPGDARDAVIALNNDVVGHALKVPAAFAPDGTAYVDALTGARYAVHNGALDLGTVDGNWGAVLLRS
ncbi:MAG: hypothetical protein JWN41_305 [Thermoleophilia bacterium]|nr:hypothetical protein [Thermoleophilia bacterium]